MKRGILILLTSFLMAFATFSYWFVVQQNINQQLQNIELQLTRESNSP